MGFLYEGSTGARALQMLREMPDDTIIGTPQFADMLGVKPGALHQLLANAVELRLIRKVRGRGPCIGWTLGLGNEGVTIERRQEKAAAPPRVERAPRQAAPAPAAPAYHFDRSWPPAFVSTFDRPPLPRGRSVDELPDDDAPSVGVTPAWLRGLVDAPAPKAEEQDVDLQLPLFSDIGPGGRALRRRARGTFEPLLPDFYGPFASVRQGSIFDA